jgi:hypothetical protein
MAELFRFFDSGVNDTREYTSAEMAEVLGKFIRDGILKGQLEGLTVAAQNPVAMGVIVNTGLAFVQGRFYKLDPDKTLAISAADAVNPRIDRIVVRLDLAADKRTITTVVKAGAPGVAPVAPALQRDATMWELSLAQVYVAAGAVSIGAADITDERADTTLCGWAVAPDIESHTHDGTPGQGPKISTGGLADGAATDIIIGDRTADQTVAPTSNTGKLANFINWFANMIKAITGKADWKTAPATTLEAANTHMGNTTNPHNTTAAQVGALVSIDGVANAGGNVDLAPGTNITITPDDVNNLITIATTAEVNQNTFANVKVGATTISADTKTDTLELVAGSGVTLTPDATNDKVTIAASGAKIASGSYTGDNVDGRTITVGFTPRLVFIARTGTGSSGSNISISDVMIYDGSGAFLGDNTDADNVVRSYAQDANGKIVTNGFTVSSVGKRYTNVNTWTYGWVALA